MVSAVDPYGRNLNFTDRNVQDYDSYVDIATLRTYRTNSLLNLRKYLSGIKNESALNLVSLLSFGQNSYISICRIRSSAETSDRLS
jgi:hypothetical protein